MKSKKIYHKSKNETKKPEKMRRKNKEQTKPKDTQTTGK